MLFHFYVYAIYPVHLNKALTFLIVLVKPGLVYLIMFIHFIARTFCSHHDYYIQLCHFLVARQIA